MIKVSREVNLSYIDFVNWCKKNKVNELDVMLEDGKFSKRFEELNSMKKSDLARMYFEGYETVLVETALDRVDSLLKMYEKSKGGKLNDKSK